MFNPTAIVIDEFVEFLEGEFLARYGGMEPMYPSVIRWAGRMTLESIATSDALYHDLEHTILVTSVGLEILKGRHLTDARVPPREWLHFVISLLCHDIGYVRGVVPGDGGGKYVIDDAGNTVELPAGASDAGLTPYHVDRGEMFVRSRFIGVDHIDVDVLVANIEHTRFPVPDGSDRINDADAPGLLRAADLIGQLPDPHYLRKLAPLFHEFRETGATARFGYDNPSDLRNGYARFYYSMVRPYIGAALRYLSVTQTGKQWVANLHSHVFVQELREADDHLGDITGVINL